jgi:preprotein translocase subunit SecA
VLERLNAAYEQRCSLETPEAMLGIERYVVIRGIDRNWQDHLTEIEDLRQSVNLRGYGQRDPLNEYKVEAFAAFELMLGRTRQDVCASLFTSATNLQSFQSLMELMKRARQIGPTDPMEPVPVARVAQQATATTTTSSGGGEVKLPKVAPRPPEPAKYGRNDIVTIRRGVETQQVKFKKAEQMLREGWTIVPEKS